LNKDEEDAPDAVDIPLGVLSNSGEIVLLQMDGVMTKEEFKKVVELGQNACKNIYEVQKKALQEKFQLTEINEKAVEEQVGGKSVEAESDSAKPLKENKKDSAKQSVAGVGGNVKENSPQVKEGKAKKVKK
jgi:PIN domain nuclease of toxin-antitoxin system